MADRSEKPGLHHIAFYAAVVIGLVALVIGLWLDAKLSFEFSAIAFFLTYLVLTGIKIRRLTTHYLRTKAADTDEPVAVIFLVTLGAVAVSIFSLFTLLNGQKDPSALQVSLSLASVGLGWLTIHTMAALHYAHIYWVSRRKVGKTTSAKEDDSGGLEFPGTPDPGIPDFFYFAFVIGMTAQTSDVVITRTGIRKLNLAHAVVSFFFNTVLVAAVINVTVSLSG